MSRSLSLVLLTTVFVACTGPSDGPDVPEIGRASCRERV